jgi:protein TonB
MFEQSVITGRKQPWTMAVSLTIQSSFVGAVVLLSILNLERLSNVVLPSPLPPLPAAPKAVEVVAAKITRSANATVAALNTFTEPARIPRTIAMIVDPPPNGVPAGYSGGIPNTGLPAGMYGEASGVITPAELPPPPQPATATAEKAAAPKPKQINIGGNVLEGKLVKRVMPEYPALARQARISGTVRLLGVVGRDGLVRELKIISGHPLLIQSAVNAVRQWVYSPTYLNGEAVEVMAPIEVHFTLAR